MAGGAAPAPEAKEIVELGEGVEEALVGDFAGTPFGDLGIGAPAAVAEGEPELGVGVAEGGEAAGGGRERRDFWWVQKREDG